MKTKDIKNVAAAWAEVQENQKAALAKKLAKASASSEKGKAAVTLPKPPFKVPGKNEALDKDDEKSVMKVVKALKGAVKAHSGQAKSLEKDIKDSVTNEALKGDQHKLDHDKDGDIDADDFKGLRKKKKKNAKEVVNTKPELKDNSKETEMSEKQESRRPIFNRIMEKAGGREDHVKGATDPEPMDSKASKGEKDFVAKHGGLGGNDSGIDGAKAAADTIKNAAAGVKVGPGRTNDNKSGDKKPIKSTEA